MLFSVIIPFYNTIEYFDDVLKSILNQRDFNINEVQVIFVNDGSSYNLNSRIDLYKQAGLNIKLFNKNNGNWGSVINYVKHNKLAIGDYITVLDSDDVLTNNCFSNTYLYLQKHKVDILVGDLSQWKSLINKKSHRKVILNWKNKFWNINKYNIHKFKTPYSFPLGKFISKEIFDQIPDLKENTAFQDVSFYYESLKLATTYGYINKVLGLRRIDRETSSTNEPWSLNKINAWVETLQKLARYDATMNAIFYLTVRGFKRSYIATRQPPFCINGKIKTCYLPKLLYPFVYSFVLYLLTTYKRILKRSYGKNK